MSKELDVIEEVLKHPDLLCFNVRHDENSRRLVATTMSMKNGSRWLKGEGETVSEAILSLGAQLQDHSIKIETRPVTVTTQPMIPGLTRRIPGL